MIDIIKYLLAKKKGAQKNIALLYSMGVIPTMAKLEEIIEKTVQGDIIHITDATGDNAVALSVALTPTQDGTPEGSYQLGLNVNYAGGTFTRLGDAVGKSAGSGFNDFSIYGNRRRCNVADNGEILAWYGDANFKEDGSNGQVMVYQPKFYYKVEPITIEEQATGIGYHLRNANYYVSNKELPGYKLHPAFYDANGDEVNYVLMGAYEACLYDTSASAYITNDAQVMTVAEDKLSSIANVKPASGSTQNLTRPNVETLAQNRGSNWHGSTVKIASMNQLLCMIEMGTMNFQTAIGQGVVSQASGSGNEASNTGATSSLGNGTGQATQTTHISSDGTETIDTTSGKLSVSYRGLENPWGNIWEFEYGVNIWGNGNMAGGEPYVADDFNFAESKRTDNYEGAGFTVTNANGYISAMGYSTRCDWLFMASECAGNSSLPVGDYTYVTPNLNGYRITLLGGSWNYGVAAGGFYWFLNGGVGYRYRNVGGRLVYVPTSDGTDPDIHPISGWDEVNVHVSESAEESGTTYTISLSQAGTVYGGTLDVVSGEMTITYAIEDLGNLSWNTMTIPSLGIVFVAYLQTDATGTSYVTAYAKANLPAFSYGEYYLDGQSLAIRDPRTTDATEFTRLVTGQKIVYKLVTPITATIDPTTIELNEGENYVWTEEGTTTLTYKAKV